MPRYRYTLALLLSMLSISATASASGAIYKWVDQNGVTQYSQTPPPKNAKQAKTVRVSTHVPVDVREGRAQGMVDAATLQAYTSPQQGTATATNAEQPAAPTSDAAASSAVNPPAQDNNTPVNNAAPAPSSTVPSTPIPLNGSRPEQL